MVPVQIPAATVQVKLLTSHTSENATLITLATGLTNAQNESLDEKDVFSAVDVNGNDTEALSTLFVNTESSSGSGACENVDQNNDLATVNAMIAPNERAKVNESGQIVVTRSEKWGEVTYIWKQQLAPKKPFYEVKMKDLISGNIPFKQDVRMQNYLQ